MQVDYLLELIMILYACFSLRLLICLVAGRLILLHTLKS